ncbi:ABC transporter substrate-binding protein [Actinoalloteichus hymeniacidonis]|uniref:ABC-type Fe3+ transport system, periplasmic component n=1 Tax=Actinoalloteichus hymeniacidonis TaxID=340345 RepID=A0AAC9N144_9PSEU|nr:ABC transporter substrate-binding protein [Actinoalloteichus hymeniacidonis]AOS65521.1 ABC-type Fe3+ transport system, periplasmic component [Actinoalloteichus hymeniacidonis]MBB5906391.1 iron(III) transport system substrate-binding protein [Actinoalloteichus hymeniacidonis]
MRKIRILASLAVAGSLVAAGCAPPQFTPVVDSSAEVDTSDGLVINGERIADAEELAAAKEEGRISLYSGYVENSEKEVIKVFEEDTGIKVDLVRLVPNRLSERVLSEQGAGRLGADVVRTSDFDIASRMREAGVFQSYEVADYDNMDETVRYFDGDFYRVFNPLYTFAYNTALVDEEDAPKSWHDLNDEQWKDDLGITQVGAGGSSLTLNRFQEQNLGEDFLPTLADQNPRIFDSSSAALESLARGEIPVATAVVSSVNIAASKNAPVNFVIPEEGMAAYDYFVGMTDAAVNTDAAELFLEWNLSKRGQDVFRQIGEFPARGDVEPPEILSQQLPTADSGKIVRIDPEVLIAAAEGDQQRWNGLFGYLG